jgi:16S rRNA processing protein RimM
VARIRLKGLKAHGDGLVVLLDGWRPYGCRSDEGRLVGAPREALPTTDEDEFYWGDLIGLESSIRLTKSLARLPG